MITQYLAVKEQNKDAILMFQVGGFYQLYYHDAELAAKELGTSLVSRAIGGGKRAPMCGFPISGGEKYAGILARKGYRVIFCNQMPEKDENGKTIRTVAKTMEPEPGVTRVDLSGAWDEYLSTRTFEKGKPREQKKNWISVEGKLLEQLALLNLEDMTPMKALILLQEWKQRYANPNGIDRLREDM